MSNGGRQKDKNQKIEEARSILEALDFPRAQLNTRSALVLLALLDMTPEREWKYAQSPLIGITPIMDWCREHYDTAYAPNTRETFRRETMHQFVEASLVLPNPDQPDRPTNSPKWHYQIEPHALELLRSFGSETWNADLAAYKRARQGLRLRYARKRRIRKIPVAIAEGTEITLTPGKHSVLMKEIIEEFAPRFVPGGKVIYVGDTGDKWGYFDVEALSHLGVSVDAHGKMPDVVLYYPERNWLLLIEAVTSHGPVNGKRHDELSRLFKSASAGLIYVTAFPTRTQMARYLTDLAWETEVWVAEAPDHLIHFNGTRFLGPHTS